MLRRNSTACTSRKGSFVYSRKTKSAMVSLVSRRNSTTCTYPDGFLFLYLLSLLVSYLQVDICWKAGRKGAGEVFMEEGLCLSCTCNPNSRIFAVIRFTNTYRFSASSDDFSRSKTNQESGEVLQTFCYVLNIEVSFLPLTLSSIVH